MDRQEVFNKAVKGLMTQGFKQSMKPGGQDAMDCAYRGTESRKCAIGWLIPDGLCSSDFEGLGVPGPIRLERALKSGAADRIDRLQRFRAVLVGMVGPIEDEDWTFLENLQKAHDIGSDPKRMESELRHLADGYSLNVEVFSHAD